jgi:DNA-directed RNA polymerase specialized sigma subunit
MSRSHVSRLTPAQRALFDSEPGIAYEAADAAWKAAGPQRWRHLTFDEVVSIATIGALEATATYDSDEALTYRCWAFFSAVHAVFHAGRDERARYVKEKALLRATVLQHYARTGENFEIGWDTEEEIAGKIHGFSDTVVDVAAKIVASMEPAERAVDEVVERETAAAAGDALRELMPEPGSPERAMLEMRFTQHMPLTQVAEAMGVAPSGYSTFVRGFHKLLAKIRAGLKARGITEMPPWLEDVSGQALGDSG